MTPATPTQAAIQVPCNSRLERLRRVWERAGVILLSGLLTAALAGLSDNPLRWSCWVLLIWCGVYGVQALCAAFAGSSTGPWVPRTGSLVIGTGIPVAAFVSGGPTPAWSPVPGHAAIYVVWSLFALLGMILHARAAAVRTGSRLFGWATGLPMCWLVLSAFPPSTPPRFWDYFAPTRSYTLLPNYLTALAGLVVLWWSIVTFLELLYLWAEEGFGPADTRAVFSQRLYRAIPFLVPVLPVATYWFHLVNTRNWFLYSAQYMYLSQGNWHAFTTWLIAVGLCVLGYGIANWVASHRPTPRERRRLRGWAVAGMGVHLLGLAFGGGWTLCLSRAILWAILAMLLVADAMASPRGGEATNPALDELPEETAALRALVALPRSPIRRWGGRRRFPLWIVPCLLWILTPVTCLYGILFAYRFRGPLIMTPGSFLDIPRFRYGFLQATILFYVLSGILCPLLLMLIRIARRFQALWKRECLAEVSLTRLGPWDVFAGVLVAPILGDLLLLVGTPVCMILTRVFAGPLQQEDLWGLWPVGRRGVYSLVNLLLAGALLLPPVAVGLVRRRIAAGYAVVGLTFSVALPLIFLVAWVLDRTFQEPLDLFLQGCCFTMLFLLAIRWALATASRSLQHLIAS